MANDPGSKTKEASIASVFANPERLEDAFRRVRGTLAHEGLVLTDEDEALIRRQLAGEITEEEFLRASIELAKRKEGL